MLAVVVELVVDTALRQYGTLVPRQGGGHRSLEAILEKEAGLHVVALGKDQEFGCAGVDVGFVHSAWVHESSRGCDAELGEGGERLAVCEVSLATESFASAGIRVGFLVEVILEPGVGWT